MNTVRNVDGFVAKYFEGNTIDAVIQANDARKLSQEVHCLADFTAVADWVSRVGSVVHADGCTTSSFVCEPLDKRSAAVYLKSNNGDRFHMVGEFCLDDAADKDDKDGENEKIDDFYRRAQKAFNAEPTRLFLHAFRVRARTMTLQLELWLFDRAGAYSSVPLDLQQQPDWLVRVLTVYARMTDKECGLDSFVQRGGPGPDRITIFESDTNTTIQLFLRPDLIAVPSYLVGLGTTCYAASSSPDGQSDCIVKFSWREDGEHSGDDGGNSEIRLLECMGRRHVSGVVRLLGGQDLASTADWRQDLSFPQPLTFSNRTLSCVATAPLGRPLQQFASVPELLEALRDHVLALRSLYLDGRMLHRDICIRNLIIPLSHEADGPRGIVIDFDQGLDIDKNAGWREPLIGSDGFMAIGILSGQQHTYRHDLESIFYVFLWMAIGNDHDHDDACAIMEHLPATSRLREWCSMDFSAVGRAKAADMSAEGFAAILDEFSAEFAHLKGLAMELHALLFPPRDGKMFTGTDTELEAVEQLYKGMADAFDQSSKSM